MNNAQPATQSFWPVWLRRFLRGPRSRVRRLKPYSEFLGREVRLEVYLPPGWMNEELPLIIFNDGQDLRRMKAFRRLRALYRARAIERMVVVGVYAGEDRMREYGTAGQPDYQGRGDRAQDYEWFIREELLPYLRLRYPQVTRDPARTGIAGFSMGGLSAFDIAWRNPGHFGLVGVFSGALWWRSTPFNPQDPDADRILHQRVYEGSHQPGMRFWFQAGTEDEQSDRNNNGIIDSIDDTLHLMDALSSQGYQYNRDFVYVEVPGGHHNPETWSRVLPHFLKWAFPRTGSQPT